MSIIAWAVSKLFLNRWDTGQLLIATFTMLVPLATVFITQNSDSAVVHLKLDSIMGELEVPSWGFTMPLSVARLDSSSSFRPRPGSDRVPPPQRPA